MDIDRAIELLRKLLDCMPVTKAEVSRTPTLTNCHTYCWGLDVSGTLDGAGGIGGLLCAGSGGTASVSSVFFCYDANGNVMALVSTTGAVVAEYDYGPFGEALQATGPAAAGNPWRFSTRYTDPETDLVMYPLRPYSPALGRFLSRDPIEEFGGFHLYGFVGNDPANGVDPLGLEGLYGSTWLYWLANQLTVTIRVPLGLAGSVLSGDALSLDSPDPVYDSDQCEFLITVTGMYTLPVSGALAIPFRFWSMRRSTRSRFPIFARCARSKTPPVRRSRTAANAGALRW